MPKPQKTHNVSVTLEALGSEHLKPSGYHFENTSLETANLAKFQVAIPMIMACEAQAPSRELGSKATIKIKTVIDGRQSNSGSQTFKDVDLGYVLDASDAFCDNVKAINQWQRGVVPGAGKSRAAGAFFEKAQIVAPGYSQTLPAGAVLNAQFVGTGPISSRVIGWNGSRYAPIAGAAIDVTSWEGLNGWVAIWAWNVDPSFTGDGLQWEGDESKWVKGTFTTVRWILIGK